MPGQELQTARPGSFVGFGPLAFPAAAVESVGRVGVVEKFMSFSELGEFGAEAAHLVRRRVLIEFAEVALDRTENIGSESGRRRPVAPLLIGAATVEIHRRFE